ncbi:MAG TPA: nuclear transport factor 2 family protein [Steroidobacteraceae bacterium]|nr:nuclear transport factor 2 family protein [Steroidobacteraceae bacterium]
MRTMKSLAAGLFASCLLTACATVQKATPPLDVVRAKFDAVNRHDLQAITAAYAPDARLLASDFCAPRVGHAAVERTYSGLLGSIEDLSVSIDQAIADGNNVLMHIRVQGAVHGQRFEVPISNYFEVRDGLIAYDLGVFDNGSRPCRQ